MRILLYIFLVLLGIWVFWMILAFGSLAGGWLERRRDAAKKEAPREKGLENPSASSKES